MITTFFYRFKRFADVLSLPVLFLLFPTLLAAQGASTPFITYEAESGTLSGGAIVRALGAMPTVPTQELEASGRKFVELNATGEAVTITSTAAANTIVVRVSIPDAAGGGGITATLNLYVNGVFRQALSFTSKYSWVYGVNGFTDNNPATGTPKRFYDEHRAFITGAAIPAGATITLKKDNDNAAAYYFIDMVDLENVGAPLTQPANTLSILTYGATPNDGTDDKAAIVACAAACVSQGKGMWIPAGTFNTATRITLTGITISGAGMWYTTLYRNITSSHAWELVNCTIRDVYIDCPAVGRGITTGGSDYGLLVKGANGWLIERVWIHNLDATWLSGTDGIIRDSRIGNSWADGININNGPVNDPQKAGIRLTVQNNYIRTTGDDGIAINAQNGGGKAGNMVDAKILNNTAICSYWANGIRVAGGRNSLVQNNLVTDPSDNNGIKVGQFGTTGNPCESVLVTGNLVLRGTGIREIGGGNGGIHVTDAATATIKDNTVIDSYKLGVLISSSNATFTSNIVIHPATTGFRIISGAAGSAQINYNTVTDLNPGQTAYLNSASGTFTASLTGNSWQSTATEVTFYQDINYGGAAGEVMPLGSYTQAQLAVEGIPNDWAFSARVPTGKKVIMYSGDNFTGTSWILTYDTPNFSVLSPGANNQMSSCSVLNINDILPVTLLSFTANADGNTAKLAWSTATEANNKEFIISRSADGQVFTEIGSVVGAGNSSLQKDYTFYDLNPLNGINYYRLQQRDLDGKIKDLGIRTLSFSLDNTVKIYPNPTADYLILTTPKAGDIQLFSVSGSLVKTQAVQPGINKVDVRWLSPGTYFCVMDGLRLKFIKN